MGNIVPDAVERYLAGLNRRRDPLLDEIHAAGDAEGLPLVDAEVGSFLRALTTAVDGRRVLEIGTAIGYSTIWLAGGMPEDGMLFTLEIDPARAARARRNVQRAGLADRVSVMVGDASLLLAKLRGPFDVIFNDGDKLQYPTLHDRLVSLLRPRGLLIVDNTLWSGEVVPGHVAHATRPPAMTRAIAGYNERLADDDRLMVTLLPFRDGLTIAVRRPGVEAPPAGVLQ